MSRRPLRRLLPALLVFVSAAAHAESPPSPCSRRAEIRPRTGALPVDAPALVFLPAQGWNFHPIGDYAIELRDQDPDVVPVTIDQDGDAYLIRPGRPLRGTELSVRFRDVCTAGGGFSTTERKVPLAPAATPPASIGTAGLRGGADFGPLGLPACLPAPVSMVVDVQMSPALQAYRELTRWEIGYRGQTTWVGYGDLQTSGQVAYVPLEDSCGRDDRSVGGPLVLRAHVAGAGDLPPVQMTIDALCPYYGTEKQPPACSGTDGGTSSSPGSPDGGSTPGARGGGCQLGGDNPATGSLLLTLIGLALALRSGSLSPKKQRRRAPGVSPAPLRLGVQSMGGISPSRPCRPSRHRHRHRRPPPVHRAWASRPPAPRW